MRDKLVTKKKKKKMCYRLTHSSSQFSSISMWLVLFDHVQVLLTVRHSVC